MPNVTLNWEKLGGGYKTTASPDSHALLNVSGGNLITQVHHKLGKLFDIDDVFGVFRVSVDDLCASVGTMDRRRQLAECVDRVGKCMSFELIYFLILPGVVYWPKSQKW